MLRKQKLADHEEHLRQKREARANQPPPVIPSVAPPSAINVSTFTMDEGNRPDSFSIVSNKASNFSRPYHTSAMPPPVPATITDPLQNQRDQYTSPKKSRDNLGIDRVGRNGEYVNPRTRTESANSQGRQSVSSAGIGNINSPRRVRRKKDPTPFK